MVTIEKEPFSSTRYFAGEHTNNEGKVHEFTLMIDEDQENDGTIMEVTWVNDEPSPVEHEVTIIEDEIKKHYDTL